MSKKNILDEVNRKRPSVAKENLDDILGYEFLRVLDKKMYSGKFVHAAPPGAILFLGRCSIRGMLAGALNG
ncbi:MAG TPA: hypothetical protein VIK64_13575 [Anaerolineales bacterium]